jgi:hypothetical protein
MNAPLPRQIEMPAHAIVDDRRAALLASLVRGLAEAMLTSVQRTTELNWAAARLLLARSNAANLHECANGSTMAWRWSWRSFRICATTAAQVLDLCRDHAQSTSEDLWRGLRQASANLPGIDDPRTAGLQASLRAMEATFDAYLNAVAGFQRDLVSLAQEESS